MMRRRAQVLREAADPGRRPRDHGVPGHLRRVAEDHAAAVEHDQAAERGRHDRALHRLDERRRDRVRGARRRRHARGPARLGLRDRRGGVRRRPGGCAGGHRRDAADRDADPRPRPAAAHLPEPRDRAGAAARGRDRVPRRRGRRVRGRAGRPLPGHRPGDRDPDRADVRRGHGLLPAAARPLPGGARDRHAGPDGHRAAPHRAGDRLRGRDRRRHDARAHASPTTTPRAGWARCWPSAPRSPCSPASRSCPPCSRSCRSARSRTRSRSARSGRASARSSAAARRCSPPPSSPCSSPARSATSRSRARSTSASSSGRRRSPSRACASCRRKFPPGQPGPVDLLVPQAIATGDNFAPLGMDQAQSVDLAGSSRDGKLALIRITLLQDPFTEMATDGHPAPAREREEVQPGGHGRRPDGGGAGLRDRALPRRAPDHPARARARVPDRRRPAAQPGRADLRRRHGDPVLRLRARRLRLHLPGDGPGDAAVHVHLPGRAGRRLQRLPAHPDQGGQARSQPRGRRDHRPRTHRRRDHERGPDPGRHVLHAARHRAREPVPGRLHRGPRACWWTPS